ncbi:CDP-glycerol glycerophosphotransferase family protein [Demetria terragena]|uniref:CDP-glycerol glycerophosphotransferase family protein n=1 Tax=Demetria terragena TaxID=63959 RepID=UPI0003711262|nr:CDP-glycerol glycerophosphotransferase family protein [Demetria terragena]
MRNAELKALVIAGVGTLGTLLMLVDVSTAGRVLWGLTWLYVAWQTLRSALKRRWTRQIGRYLSVRLILMIGTLAPLLRADGRHHVWVAVIAVLLVVLMIRTEPTIGRAARYVGTRVHGVPGLETRLARTRPIVGYVGLNLVIPPLFMVAALTGAPTILWLIPAAGVVGMVGWIVRDRLNRRVASNARYEALPEVLAELDPKFVIYWDAPRNSGYELAMWMPYLRRVDEPFFIMVRSPSGFAEARRLAEDVPVVMARTLKDVERLVIPSLRAAFYVNNGAKNSHLVRYIPLTHVQLLHGESDKPASFNPVTAMFDKIFVAGQAGVDRYANNGVSIPADKFEIVGRPQVEDIEVDHGVRTGPTTVLYAPTWRGHSEVASYSSIPGVVALFESLIARGCRVVFRPHPLSYKDPEYTAIIQQAHALLAADDQARNIGHIYGLTAEREMNVVDCFNASDAMIADISGVVADFLYSRKPFAITNGGRGREEFLAEFPLAAVGYIMDPDPATWEGPLSDLLGNDPMRETRLRAREHYLGSFPDEGYADAFVHAARRVVNG